MNELTFKTLQDYLSLKYQANRSSTALFMKLVEEIGEVAEVLNKLEGRKVNDGDSSLEKELVDVLHYTVAIAALNQIDLSKAILEKDKIATIKYHQSPNLEEFIQNKK